MANPRCVLATRCNGGWVSGSVSKTGIEVKHFLPYIFYGLLGVITSFFLIGLYWFYQPLNVIELKAPIVVTQVSPSSVPLAAVKIDYCKLQTVTGTVRTSLVSTTGSLELFQPVITDTTPKGCYNRTYFMPLPANLPSGQYLLKYHSTYQLNPLLRTEEELKSQPFEVK